MSGASKIEWTDATWNPIVGCSIVSPGCTNCYAMRMAARIEAINRAGSTDDNGYRVRAAPGAKTRDHYEGTTRKVNGNAVWTGKLALAPDHILTAPLHWKKPRRIFVNSMGDLFHENAPDEWIDKVFAVMALCPQHQFQVLTKRAERMRAYFEKEDRIFGARRRMVFKVATDLEDSLEIAAPREVFRYQGAGEGKKELCCTGLRTWPLKNVWLGVSAERQQEADERIPHLLQTPAAIRFVSCEPLLGPIDLRGLQSDLDQVGERYVLDALTGRVLFGSIAEQPAQQSLVAKLDWIIVGGESGPGARPMHPDWARALREQCTAAGVPFFFKQWGGWKPLDQITEQVITGARGPHAIVHQDGRYILDSDIADPPRAVFAFNFGKKAAGRLLDGKEHNGMPG